MWNKYHFTLTRLAIIRKSENTKYWKNVHQWEFTYWVESYNFFGNKSVLPNNFKYSHTHWPSNATCTQKDEHENIYSSTVNYKT